MLWLPLKESFICCEKRMRRDRTREKQNKKKMAEQEMSGIL